MSVVVDTSAIMAVLRQESQAHRVRAILEAADERLISAATIVELGIVVESRTGGRMTIDRVVREFGLTVVDVDAKQARLALEAWRRFSKGRHPASLNFGDCFSYALSEARRTGLLWVGDDFAVTDVRTPRLEP